MSKHSISPEVLNWAVRRSGKKKEDFAKFKISEWESGKTKPTFKQLENFAHFVYVPLHCLFFSRPPKETLPVTDFRTFNSEEIATPNANLLDTLYICQERQEWYREFLIEEGGKPLPFIGSLNTSVKVEEAANEICDKLDFSISERSSGKDALELLRDKADSAGILVMISSTVPVPGNQRTLNKEKFRRFTLSDTIAPLIFINSSEYSKYAQAFILAHELAHLWLNSSAKAEVWCNAVAAEVLAFIKQTVVEKKKKGGSYYNTLIYSTSTRFAQAVIARTLEGKTLYRDALRLLEVSKTSTLHELGRRVQIP